MNAELEKWEKAHPDIESEYYAANERERSKLLADYLRISIVDASDKSDEMGVRDQLLEQVKSNKTVDLMESIAKKVNGWETCKELLQKPELHKLITTNAPAAEREKYPIFDPNLSVFEVSCTSLFSPNFEILKKCPLRLDFGT